MLLFRSKVVVLLLLIKNAYDSESIEVCKKKYSSYDWMKHVFNYISKHFHPPLVTIFTPELKNEDFYHANHILKGVMSNITTLIVNTKECSEKDPIFKLDVFKVPRRTNFYILLYSLENFIKDSQYEGAEEFGGIFNLMTNISPQQARPRCLLILFSSKTMADGLIESISLYAWSKKFLDFTSLVISQNINITVLNDTWNQKDVVTYHYYNPFLKKHYSGYYEVRINLFPDKLYDLHGYTFNVAATNNPPYVILERNETGYPILSRVGSNYRTLRILSHKMNFTYQFAPSLFEFYTEGHNASLFNRLFNGEINFSVNHLFIRKISDQFTRLERSIITTTEQYAALVPLTLNKQVKLPEEFDKYALVGIGMIIIFYLLIYILRFDKHYWSGTRIMEILFNVTVSPHPKAWTERLIFISITFMAFNFSVIFITQMTEIQFLPYEIVSPNLSMLGKLGYTPVILDQFRDLTLEDEVEENEEFKARLQVLKTPADCAARLQKGDKIICFMTKFIGEKLINEAKERRLVPKMKLMQPYLWESWKCMMFERGSPIIVGINRVLERLRDSGLLKRFVYDVTYHRDINSQFTEAEILSKQVINSKQLMSVLIAGHIIAFTVFGLELIIHRFNININKYNKRMKILYWNGSLPTWRRWH